MDKHFPKIAAFVLEREGGYVNDPQDPGGETNYGISKRAYPNVDIRNLTKSDAVALYYRDYWLPSGADGLEFPIASCVFDSAVNCGIGRAKKWLSQTDDWRRYLELRDVYYRDLAVKKPALQKFLKGWLNRIHELKKFIESNLY